MDPAEPHRPRHFRQLAQELGHLRLLDEDLHFESALDVREGARVDIARGAICFRRFIAAATATCAASTSPAYRGKGSEARPFTLRIVGRSGFGDALADDGGNNV